MKALDKCRLCKGSGKVTIRDYLSNSEQSYVMDESPFDCTDCYKGKALPEKISGYPVAVLTWTEYESGWGSRPDGTSLHLSKEAAYQYVLDYKNSMKDKYGDRTPAEYSSPDGKPKLWLVSKEMIERLIAGDGVFWLLRSSDFKKHDDEILLRGA